MNGVRSRNWRPVQKADAAGRFVRQASSFRNWITPDGAPGPRGAGGFRAAPGRCRLYLAQICPWASRTLIARKLKRSDDLAAVTVVDPSLTDEGRAFGGAGEADPLFGARHVHELYTRADPHVSGRATVPVLWDEARGVIVNNESADIPRMFDTCFEGPAPQSPRLAPEASLARIDALNAAICEPLNNGVYKAGFASSQVAYDEAAEGVFLALDMLEDRLEAPFLFGDAPTETDIRLFVTLIRFDAAYHGLFKCNRRRIADHPWLSAHTARMPGLPGVRETVNMDHILAGYCSVKALNPTGIVPRAPDHVAALPA